MRSDTFIIKIFISEEIKFCYALKKIGALFKSKIYLDFFGITLTDKGNLF